MIDDQELTLRPFNEQLEIASIPRIDTVEFQKLDPGYRWVLLGRRIISLSFLWLAIIIVIIIMSLWSYDYLWLSLIILSILSLASIYFSYISFDMKKYALRDRDILFKEGVFWKSESVIPFNRVQHSEVKKGPLDELFSLGKLHVYTAGGSSSDLMIPGLSYDIAQNLRDFVLGKQIQYDEEE